MNTTGNLNEIKVHEHETEQIFNALGFDLALSTRNTKVHDTKVYETNELSRLVSVTSHIMCSIQLIRKYAK